MIEAGPGPAPFMKDVKQKSERSKKESGGFFTEFLKGSREKVAIGLGALILSMSGAAAAEPWPIKRVERVRDAFNDLDKAVEEAKVSPEDVATARKSFDSTLDLLAVSAEAKNNMRKALDATLSELSDLEEQMETIMMFREQVEARLQKRETPPAPVADPQKASEKAEKAEPAAAPAEKGETSEAGSKAVVVFSSEKVSGKVVVKKSSDGKGSLFVVEGEASVSADDLVKAGLLKADFIKHVKGSRNISLAGSAVEARMRVLFLLQEAAKAARAQGQKEAADDLDRQMKDMKERIKKNTGDIIP